jgi:hypothetical protein
MRNRASICLLSELEVSVASPCLGDTAVPIPDSWFRNDEPQAKPQLQDRQAVPARHGIRLPIWDPLSPFLEIGRQAPSTDWQINFLGQKNRSYASVALNSCACVAQPNGDAPSEHVRICAVGWSPVHPTETLVAALLLHKGSGKPSPSCDVGLALNFMHALRAFGDETPTATEGTEKAYPWKGFGPTQPVALRKAELRSFLMQRNRDAFEIVASAYVARKQRILDMCADLMSHSWRSTEQDTSLPIHAEEVAAILSELGTALLPIHPASPNRSQLTSLLRVACGWASEPWAIARVIQVRQVEVQFQMQMRSLYQQCGRIGESGAPPLPALVESDEENWCSLLRSLQPLDHPWALSGLAHLRELEADSNEFPNSRCRGLADELWSDNNRLALNSSIRMLRKKDIKLLVKHFPVVLRGAVHPFVAAYHGNLAMLYCQLDYLRQRLEPHFGTNIESDLEVGESKKDHPGSDWYGFPIPTDADFSPNAGLGAHRDTTIYGVRAVAQAFSALQSFVQQVQKDFCVYPPRSDGSQSSVESSWIRTLFAHESIILGSLRADCSTEAPLKFLIAVGIDVGAFKCTAQTGRVTIGEPPSRLVCRVWEKALFKGSPVGLRPLQYLHSVSKVSHSSENGGEENPTLAHPLDYFFSWSNPERIHYCVEEIQAAIGYNFLVLRQVLPPSAFRDYLKISGGRERLGAAKHLPKSVIQLLLFELQCE